MGNVEEIPPNNRIAFFGPMASGKTFLANHLIDKYGFIKLSFADELKRVAKELFNIEKKDGKSREIYQKLGESLRAIDDNVWIRAILRKIERYEFLYGNDVPLVIDDCRYGNEFTTLWGMGFLMVKVDTPTSVRTERIERLYPDTPTSALNHISERDLSEVYGDQTINSTDNFALEDLESILWQTH